MLRKGQEGERGRGLYVLFGGVGATEENEVAFWMGHTRVCFEPIIG